jgi:hypothetical protein
VAATGQKEFAQLLGRKGLLVLMMVLIASLMPKWTALVRSVRLESLWAAALLDCVELVFLLHSTSELRLAKRFLVKWLLVATKAASHSTSATVVPKATLSIVVSALVSATSSAEIIIILVWPAAPLEPASVSTPLVEASPSGRSALVAVLLVAVAIVHWGRVRLVPPEVFLYFPIAFGALELRQFGRYTTN